MDAVKTTLPHPNTGAPGRADRCRAGTARQMGLEIEGM